MSYKQINLQELESVRNLLLALEVGNRKEDKKLINGILSRHNISSSGLRSSKNLIDSLSYRILEGPGFESFFLDVVSCVRPFAMMLQDVYSFLAKYTATIERRSSAIRVSLKGAKHAFDFDPSCFPTEQIEMITRVRGQKEIIRLTPTAKIDVLNNINRSTNCWNDVRPIWDGDFYDDGFFRVLSYASTILSRGDGDKKSITSLITPILDRLSAIAQILKWQEIFPDQGNDVREKNSYMDDTCKILHLSLPKQLSSILDREDTIQVLHSEAMSDSLYDLKETLDGFAIAISIWNQEDFRRQDNRDWLSERLGMPFNMISFGHYMPLLEEETQKVLSSLERLVEVIRVESFEEEVRAIIDFLRLPFWRDRWFLYELWTVVYVLGIGSATWLLRLKGLEPRNDGGVEWILPGGVAKEPIAVLEGKTCAVECWSQRKTFLPGTRKGLEPDLRLTRASAGHEDLIVIENKDRSKPRKSEIEEIIERYVNGTQAQAIWLVNYEGFTAPTHAFGSKWSESLVFVESHFRPGEVSDRFVSVLRQILIEELGNTDSLELPVEEVPLPDMAATVTLIWEKPPIDLDIHAWSQEGSTTHHVYYNNRGRLGSPPYVRLDTDCQNIPGREEMTIGRVSGESVEIAICQYSNDGQIEASQATVEIRQPGYNMESLSVPRSGQGKWWRICTIGHDGKIDILNKLTPDPPGELS